MTELGTMTLNQCCTIVSGATPKTSIDEYWDGDICWTTPKDLSKLETHYLEDTPRKITKIGLASCGASILPIGSVLFSSRAPIGHVAINVVPMATNQGFKSFIPKTGVLDAKFLFHWLRKNKDFLESLGNGATFKEVSKATVSRIEIYLPTIAEQRRIAAILDQADALRAKRRDALAQLDSLTQSIFIEIFGDPISNPKKWQVIPFKDACETKLGKMLDARQQTGLDKRSYLRNANVQWFRVDLFDLLEMDFDSDARKKFSLQKGDLLICEGGDPGRAAIWQGELEDIYFQKALHRGRPTLNVANSEYLVWLLWFLSQNGALGDHVTAATIAHLTGEKLKAMPIPVPPLALQQKFARRLKSIEAIKDSHSAALTELNTLFASLQHRAFRGEL
jgi:type I restriction enzyme S subunit